MSYLDKEVNDQEHLDFNHTISDAEQSGSSNLTITADTLSINTGNKTPAPA